MKSSDARPWRHLYKTARWRLLRLQQLALEPCCEYCAAHGRVVAATIVDHRLPHKGDEYLFHNPDNLQSLCKQHHDSTKQREEHHGASLGGDVNGNPLDPSHHWNT